MSDDELVERWTPLAWRLAWRCESLLTYAPALEVSDLVQAGLLAMLRAVPRHDASRGTLLTFLYPRMLGAMLDEIRKEPGAHRYLRRTFVALDDAREIPDDRAADGESSWPMTLEELLASDLTARERYVLTQLASGKTQTAIGAELGITESRVSQIKYTIARRMRCNAAAS